VTIKKLPDGLEEEGDLSSLFEELNDRTIKARNLFVGFVASWIVHASAVEDIPTSVA
jgi:hypothetical protein